MDKPEGEKEGGKASNDNDNGGEEQQEQGGLLPHQVEGVRWMLGRERSESVVRGGIQADDMGLGKTVQVACLLRERPLATLIITTASTLAQWRDELLRTLRRRATSLTTHTATELPIDVCNTQVYITTYDVIFTLAESETSKKRKRKDGASDPMRSPLHRQWGRIVLDEAHIIRNQNTKRYIAIMQLNADHKWALTGTPINNRVKDLDALSEWVGIQLVGCPENQRLCILRRTTEGLARAAATPAASIPRGGGEAAASCSPPPALEPPPGATAQEGRDGRGRETGGRPPLPSAPPSLTTTIETLDFRHAEEKELYARVEQLLGASMGSSMSHEALSSAQIAERAMETATNGAAAAKRAMEGVTRLRQICVHPRLYAEGVMRSHASPSASSVAAADDDSGVDAAENLMLRRRIETERQLIDLANGAPGGTKIEYVSERIAQDCAADDGVKVVVFCEWVREMDLLEEALRRTRREQIEASPAHGDKDGFGSGCVRLQGSLPPCDRAMRVMMFNNAPAPREPRVMLAQIRTGGVGLNLQAASCVYIMSPNWNPCNELQAMSRAYRHGQTREVRCTRFVMRGTVEERCLEKQRLKVGHLDSLLSEGGMHSHTEVGSAAARSGGAGANDHQGREKGEDGMIMTRRMGFDV